MGEEEREEVERPRTVDAVAMVVAIFLIIFSADSQICNVEVMVEEELCFAL